MKIIDARTGQLQTIPFTLGQDGRGRHLERIDVSNRSGQAPAGPEDVSYFTFGPEGRQHCVLTRADNRRGVLLRINTAGVYTRGSCGRISLVGGPARCLASGRWAQGDAGRLSDGPDALWHVEGPALLEVVLEGGAHKGMGLRFLVVTRDLVPRMLEPDALVQLIAMDGDPDVTDVVREFQEQLAAMTEGSETTAQYRRDVIEAIHVADQLEDLEAAPVAVAHFCMGDIRAAVERHGITIPQVFADGIGGVAEVRAGTLIPGQRAMVALAIGPGGGKRHSYRIIEESGMTRLATERGHKSTSESVLMLVDDPTWRVAWVESRDGSPTKYVVADAGGIHTLTPAWDDQIRTEAWPGHAQGAAPGFKALFVDLDVVLASTETQAARPWTGSRVVGPETPAPTREPEPAKPATMGDLMSRFGSRR